MGAIYRILANKYRVFDNSVKTVGRHVFIHIFLALAILVFVWAGGLFIFRWMFLFLKQQEPFGLPLINRLMSMVLVAFFFMLVFSNLIITLSTTYVSREVEYFMSLPLSMSQIYWAKFIETTIYSSWAFGVMAMPVFVAYGQALEAGLTFFPALLLLLLPFTVIPAAIGALITMLVAAFVPARRARTLALALGAISIAVTVVMIRLMGGRAMRLGGVDNDFGSVMAMLSFGARPYLPNVWIVRGMLAAANGQWRDYAYWLAMLSSTALMVGQVCAWLAPLLYYRGWAMARDSGSLGRVGPRGSVFDRLDRWLRPLPPHARALIGKDARVFWRDPVQWSQLLILCGLLVIYVANIRTVVPSRDGDLLLTTYWKARISFFNMGAACFILSILSTRFMYPMLSLEGRQAWIVSLAPMKREALVWQKYWFCWAGAALLTEAIVVFSCLVMSVERDVFALSMVTILVLSFGLTSLAIGLGAMTPNFREDNPARIANGLGGTVNVILSLIYVGVVLGLEAAIYLSHQTAHHFNAGRAGVPAAFLVVALIVVNVVVIVAPMYLGLRRWRQLEF